MKSKLIYFSLLFSATLIAQPKSPSNKAFKRGEVLSYRVHYGLMDAGEATVAIAQDSLAFNNHPTFHLVGTGSSRSAFEWFYKVRDRYDSYIDEQTLLPHLFLRRVDEGGFIINQDYKFNQSQKTVNVKREGSDQNRNTPSKQFSIPTSTHDILSAFYYARNMPLEGVKMGDVITIQTFFDEEIFPMKIKLIGRETLHTRAGKIRCIKIHPLIQQGRVFKEEDDLTLWVSDDLNRIPVRIQAEVLVGSIKMDLKGYSNLANPLALESK
ncbi:MAG: hypothetical protein RLZZ543_181 [Bacteroidota bacterium]|jgi:hypothetical protein